MSILQIGNPILEKKVNRISNVSDEKLQKFIGEMVENVLSDEESAGLAAPQVGEDAAVCVVKKVEEIQKSEGEVEQVAEVIVMINPEIIEESADSSIFWEGCLSVGVGDERLFGPVKRPRTVTVRYLDREGVERKLEAEGFFSHVVQHEVDHLNGILFLQYITDPENIWKSKELDEYIDKEGKLPDLHGVTMQVPQKIVD